jgi:hypothetical protein
MQMTQIMMVPVIMLTHSRMMHLKLRTQIMMVPVIMLITTQTMQTVNNLKTVMVMV